MEEILQFQGCDIYGRRDFVVQSVGLLFMRKRSSRFIVLTLQGAWQTGKGNADKKSLPCGIMAS